MSGYENLNLCELLKNNTYPGRGVVVGTTADGKHAVAAYFIMGRSANSRNRVFKRLPDGTVITAPFDESRVEDPSLIIYNAVRPLDNRLIVTNGDQTDTICVGLRAGRSFSEALESRCFEPDAPNYTPRISALLTFGERFAYQMSILKSADAQGTACARYTFDYPSLPGVGHFLHTYRCDGNPIPSFEGEPERVAVGNDLDAFAEEVWDSLNEANKISLYVRFTNLQGGAVREKIINKNI